MMHRRLLGAGLTAREANSILAHPNDFRTLGADAIPTAHRRSREREAIGGVVLGAVSDHPHFEAPASPATRRPVGVPPRVTDRVTSASTMLLEPADNIPAIVASALAERFRRIPGSTEHRCRATAHALAGMAKPLHGPFS